MISVKSNGQSMPSHRIRNSRHFYSRLWEAQNAACLITFEVRIALPFILYPSHQHLSVKRSMAKPRHLEVRTNGIAWRKMPLLHSHQPRKNDATHNFAGLDA